MSSGVGYTPDDMGFSAEDMVDLRYAVAEVMGVEVDELSSVTDEGIIEMAFRHGIIYEE